MLLEDVDEKKISTNMRDVTTNCPQRIDNMENKTCSASESHVDAINNTESCSGPSCGCIYDRSNSTPKVSERNIPRVEISDYSELNSPIDINENVQEDSQEEDDLDNINRMAATAEWSCPRICIDSSKRNRTLVSVDNDSLICNASDNDEAQDNLPVIRLSLRKPRHWNWKLTTSTSSPAIMLPAIQLMDEQGDLLLDTRVSRDSKAPRKKHVDGNGNDSYFHSSYIVNRPLQKSKSERFNIYKAASESLGKESVQEQGDKKRNLLLNEKRTMIPKREDNADNAKEECKSNRVKSSSRLMNHSITEGSEKISDKNEYVAESIKGCRTKTGIGLKKLSGRPPCLHNRYKLKKKKNPDVSSSSNESSPRIHRRNMKKNVATHGKRGDRLLEINGHQLSSYEEATELLRNGSDVVHLKFLHRRHSNSHHDPGSPPTASRRSKRRHHNGYKQDPLSLNQDSGMGSNVSRHSEKGLSGRRTQSSGNLCNGTKILAPNVGRILVPCTGVGPKDRNKFCGSLPNHLDSKHGEGDLSDSCCNGNNNNNIEHIPSSSTPYHVKNKRNDVKLTLHRLPMDPSALHDQGYGSERSPEDEQPPSLPGMPDLSKYPFITREETFDVYLAKGSRGLGLSVTGGIDSGEQWPGLIRIKRLFPHQPAWEDGQLKQGDILLAVNGVPLVGLTNYQALEVLRKTTSHVLLTVCRPPSDIFCIQAPTEPPPPPRRDPAHSISTSSHNVLPLPPLQTEGPCGEFDIMLTKVNRSLGFTLRKEDESVLGHYVRALVREPALSDGRIRPGDKIVAVNDVDISPMSHEEAVMFLRQCGDHVKLRLYRDAVQTPVSAHSPTEEAKVFKPKPLLRKEAMDMLSNLAVKKASPGDSSSSSYSKLRRVSDGQSSSPCSSPRRHRLTKTPSPDVQSATLERVGQKYMIPSHVGNSDSSGEHSRTSTFTYPSMDSTKARGNASSFGSSVDSIDMKPTRPNFLDLCGGNSTPGAARKQKFTFSVAATGGDDWDSLAPTSESDELATNTTLGSVSQYYPTTSNSSEDFRTDGVENCDPNYDGGLPTEPASMPPLTNLSSTSSTSTAFSYKNPAYQSAHPACYATNNQNSMRKGSEDGNDHVSDQDIPGKVFSSQAGSGGEGSRGLLKWKGVVFTPENDEMEKLGSGDVTTNTDDTSSQVTDKENELGDQVFMVELTRGWNSRLGFSLRGDGRNTYISAIYADSVAAKDGRLQAGDQVLMVNDESVEDMTTADVIDLLRKIRGTIGITVLRRSGPNPQVS